MMVNWGMINEKRYPIKQVARRTGLSAHVIRAWEKRYQLVDPARTDTNRRLYSESDIQRLSLLGRLTGMGHAISSIADLDFEGLQRLLAQTSGETVRTEQIRKTEVAGLRFQGNPAQEAGPAPRPLPVLRRPGLWPDRKRRGGGLGTPPDPDRIQ